MLQNVKNLFTYKHDGFSSSNVKHAYAGSALSIVQDMSLLIEYLYIYIYIYSPF